MESIRAKYNPEQYNLIAAHVTLCREDEIEFIYQVIENSKSSRLAKPVCFEFDKTGRFSEGKGVLLPHKGENHEFQELGNIILKGIIEKPRNHEPPITLMPPRNSVCTIALFARLSQYTFPTELHLNKISLIKQKMEANGKL